jgi:hypothetical protein
MKLIAASILTLLVFSGCKTPPRATIDGASAIGVLDAGTPATANKDEYVTEFEIPKGSQLVITKVDATQTTPATVVESWMFSESTKYASTSTNASASSGTIDTAVASHRIDVEAREPLMYTGIGLIIAGAILVFNPWWRWPLGGIGFAGAGALFLFAHDNPRLFSIGVGLCIAAGCIMAGAEIMDRVNKKKISDQ